MNATHPIQDTFLNKKEAAARYRISLRTLERHKKKRFIRFHKVGGKICFKSSELEEDYARAGNRIVNVPMKPVRIGN